MGIIEKLLALLGIRATPQSLTQKARGFAAREDVMKAVENFKKALEADPLFVPAYDGLGKVYFRMGFREEADREFDIADVLEKLESDPYDVEAAVKMGRAMINKGLAKHAQPYLENALKKHSRHADLLKTVGACYLAVGADKKARQVFETGLQRWPRDADFYTQLASVELKLGNNKEGERLNQIATMMAKIDSNPMDHGSRYQLGRLFADKGLHHDAAEYLRQAVGIDKNNAEYWQFLGETYSNAGLFPAAVDAFKMTARLSPADPKPQKNLARVYQVMSRYNEAREAKALAEVLEGGQGEPQSATQGAKFAKYLLSIGQAEQAEAAVNECLEKWPDSIDLKLLQGRILYKKKQFMDAIQVLKPVAQQKENWAEPHIWMALAYQRLGDSMSALAEGQLATRLAPKSYVAHKVLGDILREQKKFGMAENAYETAENLKGGKK